MPYNNSDSRLRRKEAVGMEQLVRDFIREMKISSGINRQRAAHAWNAVSGASGYTLDVSLDRGVLYVTISSSVARNHLYFQRDTLLKRMNEFLAADTLFMHSPGIPPVRNIVLR